MENDQELELEPTDGENEDGEAKKPKLTPEQLRGIRQRQFTKLAKELGIELPKTEEKTKREPERIEKTNFDYAEMAYLEAKGVSDEDYPIVLEAVKSTGKSLREVLSNRFVQSELKDAKAARETKEALPSDSKRAGTSSRDSVEYWLQKGQLPPADQVKLRREVVKAKLEASKGSNFATQAVVAPSEILG